MINKEELIKRIEKYFTDIYFNREAETNYLEALRDKYNIHRGIAAGYMNGTDDISRIPDALLYQFADCSTVILNLSDYFGPQEIREYSKKQKAESKIDEKIIFTNVIPVADDQWVTTVSSERIFQLYQDQRIVYNTFTQRAPRVKVQDGIEIYSAYVNEAAVKSIKNLIQRRQFIPNDITFNVRDDDWDKLNYDEANAELELSSGTLDILDGYHRYQAILRVMMEDPSFKMNFVLNIMKFAPDKARLYIAQQDKKNKMKTAYARSLDTSRYETMVVNLLNDDANSFLKGKVSPIKRSTDPKAPSILDNISYVKTCEDVRQNFNIDSNIEAKRVERFIADELNNYIIEGGREFEKSFDAVDLRIAIICLGYYYKFDKKPDYKTLVKQCIEFKKTIGEGGGSYASRNIKRELLSQGILK